MLPNFKDMYRSVGWCWYPEEEKYYLFAEPCNAKFDNSDFWVPCSVIKRIVEDKVRWIKRGVHIQPVIEDYKLRFPKEEDSENVEENAGLIEGDQLQRQEIPQEVKKLSTLKERVSSLEERIARLERLNHIE